MELRCYADKREKICLEFHPCVNTGENITWEEWHTSDVLFVLATDYDMLLPYFKSAFPLSDPTNGEKQEFFDLCSQNWIGRKDWQNIIENIKNHISSKEDEKVFFEQFIKWIETQLLWANIIVVDGNL